MGTENDWIGAAEPPDQPSIADELDDLTPGQLTELLVDYIDEVALNAAMTEWRRDHQPVEFLRYGPSAPKPPPE